MRVYRVQVNKDYEQKANLPKKWPEIDGKHFATAEGAEAAVSKLFHEARPTLAYRRILNGLLIELIPNTEPLPTKVVLIPVDVSEE